MRYVPLLIALMACNKENDLDGDGYVAGVDCNEADENVHPEAPEACNDIDDDCDGEIDEDATEGPAWFNDRDGDGFGGEDSKVSCVDLPGYSLEGGDCDDTEDEIYPGATELCNDIDDDCDGTVDPDTSEDAPTWYVDADGDGYGAGDAIVACDVENGVAIDGDCDDDNKDFNPHGFEFCDGEDNDCDGVADDGNTEPTPYYPDVDGDGFGDTAGKVDVCGEPFEYILDGTDCDDAVAAVNPDADEVCNEIDDDCDGVTDPSTSLDAKTWYIDGDGDGVGAGESFLACEGTGASAEFGDCNDENGDIAPGFPDRCSDATDRNCDDVVDGCEQCHPWEPVNDFEWEKTFEVVMSGESGTEVQSGGGEAKTSEGIDGFEMDTVLSAGTTAWDAASFTNCDEAGNLFQLESAGSYTSTTFGTVNIVAIDAPARQVLPKYADVETGVTWTFSYSLEVTGGQQPVEIYTDGTSTEAGLELVTVPAGTFEAWKITSSYSQDFEEAQGDVVFRTSTFWYAEGLGLVKEVTLDEDGAEVIHKELASWTGL